MKYSIYPTYNKLCIFCKSNFRYVLTNAFKQKKLEMVSLLEVKFVNKKSDNEIKPFFWIKHEEKYFGFFYKTDLSTLKDYKSIINKADVIEINSNQLDISNDLIIEHNTDLNNFVSTLRKKYIKDTSYKNYINFNNDKEVVYMNSNQSWIKIMLILILLLFIWSSVMTVYVITNRCIVEPIKPEPPDPPEPPELIDITELLPGAYLGQFSTKQDARNRINNIIFKTKYIVLVDDSQDEKFILTGDEKAGYIGSSIYTYEIKK
ncbi:hypothetical protein [Spiroplasma diminutum]|uniref:Uncharacterized protein n=1 Tax=Spiroplasma diminutum CUAS-1 TaxID=1276221 RepID=S5M071_9MOLU|nr:hypothetical protein [Spiroplasma diminutum]AGR42241.1 hypothetical protein SDIMI_v3c05370 [Spiroplasma diminutum CUAS-1]